jgi:hypothetical protein
VYNRAPNTLICSYGRQWTLLHIVSEPAIKATLINESDGKVENNEMDKRNEHRISVRKHNE